MSIAGIVSICATLCATAVIAADQLSEAEVDSLCPPRPETAAAFREWSYPPAARPYREAAMSAFAYMVSLPAMRTLVETGEPEQTYQHNAYVSKTHAAHINNMLELARREPARREEAMRFAAASAEYLLTQLESPNAPMAWWPPTYGREPLQYDPDDGGENRPSMVGNEPESAVRYRGQVMLLYPADVGAAFVAYFNATNDSRFLNAAIGIGETYLATRRHDGSWPLKMWLATGEPIGDNTLVPTKPMAFFNALAEATGNSRWADAADSCFAWLEANPLTDWNWDGQFEDVEPSPPYTNPTKHNAVDAMLEILRRYPGDQQRIEQCRRILRFCEKRFVCWETPSNHPQWDTPSVLEQSSCFVPIDASAAKMIRAYLALWRATGEPELLAKARALGDTITRVQEPNGRIPTFWTHDTLGEPLYDWLNCMGSSASALLELDDISVPPSPAPAGDDWYVAPGGTGDGTSPTNRGDLMSVLYNGQVAGGDTIHLAAGTYNLDVGKIPAGSGYGAYLRVPDGIYNLTLAGETGNPDDVRLVGNPADGKRIIYFPSWGNVVRDISISGGYTDYQGAGICMADNYIGFPEAAFCASNCVVENCSAAYQGANFGGLWRDCVIRNNEVRNKTPTPSSNVTPSNVEGSGGGVFHATLYNCVVTNNVAGFCGGGIAGGRGNGNTSGKVCVTKAHNCLIGWNRSVYGGGAGSAPAYCTRSHVQLFGCTIIENAAPYDATGDGGGLGGGAYQCVVSNCVIRGNASTRPSGYTFSAYGHDYTYGAGGGVMDCEVVDSVIEGNTSFNGGAGAACSSLTGCEIKNNAASGSDYRVFGGGAFGSIVKDCVLSGNSAKYGGGAFEGSLENCVISNNYAYSAEGGATYDSSTRNCIVVGNRAKMYYALCKGSHYGDLVYGNSNEKLDTLAASGIGADAGEAEAVAVNCTVWGNDNSSAQVSRTAMTNCLAGSVEYIPSAANSFWRYGTVANQTGCVSGEDKNPMFKGVSLSEHPAAIAGFAPSAFAIKPGSPCRDRGLTLNGQRNETDILGNPRVKHGCVDMGALECAENLSSNIVVH